MGVICIQDAKYCCTGKITVARYFTKVDLQCCCITQLFYNAQVKDHIHFSLVNDCEPKSTGIFIMLYFKPHRAIN